MYIWVFRFFRKAPLPPKFKKSSWKDRRVITSGIFEFPSVSPHKPSLV